MDNWPDHFPASFAGRYTIERVLGRGATATVFLARDAKVDRFVAIKVLKPDLAESIGEERFLREIRMTQRLSHPNIVPVLDSGESERKLYFVLPVMDKGTLRDLLRKEPQLPIARAVEIARTVAAALDYAHKKGVIHRDVKPDNILMSDSGVCLADFGIARAIERAIDESSTSTGIVRGTPAYMSPEQASGEHDYDGRSDIFSLACVLYEMIAGVHAFVGPTSHAVMAQRLLHPARPIGVYRQNVPVALESVLQRALEILPTDRYKTAAEFSEALAGSLTSERTRAAAPQRRFKVRRTHLFAAATLVVGVTAAVAATWRPWEVGGRFGPVVDTTRIVIFPVEGEASAPRSQAYDLLQQHFAKWNGVNLVDEVAMRDIRGSESAVESEREARDAAGAAGAGRFVRTRLTSSGDNLRLWSGLYDTASGARLYETTATLPKSFSGAPAAIADAVDALLLRHPADVDPGSKVLPAVQLLASALKSIEAFDLGGADSLLMASLEADPKYARSALWLGQVRNWKLEPTAKWLTWAERANSGSGLTARESEFGRALIAMGKREFPAACVIYDSLKSKDGRDFASWYGVGQCHRQDDAVIPDRESPSGWRFRSSSHQAALAYARAFELAPALHQNFEAEAYSKLRDLLYSRRSALRPGVSLTREKGRFLAYASLQADTIVHVPYPREMVTRGLVRVDPAGRSAALARQREVFSRLAQSWAAALPRSPATKEALAVSLEMLGDSRAVDTLRVARALATEPTLRLRLAAEEVFMRISFARTEPRQAAAARALADSLLAMVRSPTREQAAVLSPVAVVVGKCALAARLAARSVDETQAAFMELPLHLVAAAESLTVLSAAGCRATSDTGAISSAFERGTSPAARDSTEYALFGRAVSLTYPLDSSRISRLASSSGDYVLVVQTAALTKHGDIVRSTLGEKQRLRPAADVTPDALYAEARAWLEIGQATAASAWIDPVLARRGWLELMLNDPVWTGALLRTVGLRADLARAANDSTAARRWAFILAQLWSGSDSSLQGEWRRMVNIGGN